MSLYKPEITVEQITKLIKTGVAIISEELEGMTRIGSKSIDVVADDGTRLRAWVSINSLSSSYFIVQNKDRVRTAYSARVMTDEGIAREQAQAKQKVSATFKKHNGVWLILTKPDAKVGEVVEVGRKDLTFVRCELTKVVVKKRDGTFLMAFKEVGKMKSSTKG